MIFWRPKGLAAYRELERYFRELEREAGYLEIANPLLYSREPHSSAAGIGSTTASISSSSATRTRPTRCA